MKNLYKSPLILKAVKYFVDHPFDEIYLREFANQLEVSPNTAQRFLDYLLEENFLTSFRKGNLKYFKPNLDSVVFRHVKITFSLRDLENSGLIDELKDAGISHLILFGSVAKGEDSLESDIDLVGIGMNKDKFLKILSKKEEYIRRKIEGHFFRWPDWKEVAKKNKAFYSDVVSTGIPLINEIPLVV